MGFLGCLLRRSGSCNGGPRLMLCVQNRLFGSMATLEDVKHHGTLEQKKSCLKDILGAMAWRIRRGIEGGCMDPKKIRIIHKTAYLPVEDSAIGKSSMYLSSVKSLAEYLHENDQMSTRDRMKFDDLKIKSGLLSTVRHLVLLQRHPHMHTTIDEMRYIPAALLQMKSVPVIPNFKFPYQFNHFPLPDPNCHQVPVDWVTDPQKLLYTWEDAYKHILTREVNIKRSIKGAGRKLKGVYMFKGKFKTEKYINNDATDELYYYSNVIKHACKYGESKTLDLLHERFPSITTEMYGFHWMYDGHAMGTVDLVDIVWQDASK